MTGFVGRPAVPATVVAGSELNVFSGLKELQRDVHGILGIPIDATDMNGVLSRIYAATADEPLWISTPNLDFLASSRSDPEFRESLLLSDLCVPDGMPIVWISRLIGIPLKRRITGADIFATLKKGQARRVTTFLFGGADGIAALAERRINQGSCGLSCVGTLYPGFGSIEEMSGSDTIETINRSKAFMLAIGLPAKKGQPWLLRNRDRLTVPVRASLGATLNFQAGTLARAPAFLQRSGLEWLWRIKQEPHLWKRYGSNLRTLLYLLPARVFPLAAALLWAKFTDADRDLTIQRSQSADTTVLAFTGAASARHAAKAAGWIAAGLSSAGSLTIDMSRVTTIDTRFIGLLLMARKSLEKLNQPLRLVGVPFRVQAMLRLNGFGYLLDADSRR